MLSCQHDHIHLTSPGPEEADRFYSQVLGARITNMRESGGRKIFDIGVLVSRKPTIDNIQPFIYSMAPSTTYY